MDITNLIPMYPYCCPSANVMYPIRVFDSVVRCGLSSSKSEVSKALLKYQLLKIKGDRHTNQHKDLNPKKK